MIYFFMFEKALSTLNAYTIEGAEGSGCIFDYKLNILYGFFSITKIEIWCPRQDSNLRLSAPEADALSPELRGHEFN